MDRKITVTVDGREYPCYPTMGACVRFHDITGKEVAEIKGWQTSLQCVYLYCCVKSACEREKKEFPYECTEFCDNVPLEMLYSWLEASSEKVTEEEAEKKSPSESANS